MEQNHATPAKSGPSLLPDDYVRGRAESRANLLVLVLFVAVMGGVVAAFLVTNRRWSDIRSQQDSINVHFKHETEKIEQLKSLEAQRSTLIGKAEVTAALIERVPRSLLLAELTTRMPKDVTLVELQLESKRLDEKLAENGKGPTKDGAKKVRSLAEAKKGAKPDAKKADSKKDGAPGDGKPEEVAKPTAPKFEHTLTLSGVAAVNNDIATYLGSLQSCPLLQDVELAFIRETIVNDLGLRQFEIRAKVRAEPVPVAAAEEKAR